MSQAKCLRESGKRDLEIPPEAKLLFLPDPSSVFERQAKGFIIQRKCSFSSTFESTEVACTEDYII